MKDPTHLYEGELTGKKLMLVRIIAVLLLPTIFTIPVFMILCLPLLPDWGSYAIAVAVTTVMISVLPSVNVFYFSKKTNNKDGDVEKREERIIPMITGIAIYVLAAVVIWFIEAPYLVKVFAATYPVSTTIMLVITLKWKISLHMSGIAGPVCALGTMYFPLGWISAVILPIAAWARYVQRKHTPAQLIAGTAEGIIVTMAMFFIFL